MIGKEINIKGEDDEEISTPPGTMIVVATQGRVKGARGEMKTPIHRASIIRGTR